MARASELRELNDEELAHRLEEAREELFSLRFQLAVGKQDNSARLGYVRREVARVLTLQHERQIDRSQPAVASAPGKRAKRKAAD
jgi:large subunit ribosomal protein L29